MNQELQNLIDISHFYGQNKDYVIAGGGNTSLKNEEYLWIKSSGIALADIDENGFVLLSRKELSKILEKSYSNNPKIREEQVKNDLNSCILSDNGRRPSVETSLHDIMDFKYVVHTHPTLVNALMCSLEAEKYTRKLFGDEALFVEYTDPGYTLFKKIYDRSKLYKEQFGRNPNLIFSENHGIFIAGDTIGDVKDIYTKVANRILEAIHAVLPDSESLKEHQLAVLADDLSRKFELKTSSKSSPLIYSFVRNRDAFEVVSKPYTPDHIVYCKSKYLFIEEPDINLLTQTVYRFKELNGYLPRVIAVKGMGLIIMEENEKAVETVLDLFENMMKISTLALSFGGPQPMSAIQIAFIDNWEVENYRRKIARQN